MSQDRPAAPRVGVQLPKQALVPPGPPAGRGPSRVELSIAALLIGDAILSLTGVRSSPGWLPLVECLAACLLGLRTLRRLDEDPPAPAQPGRVPARVETPPEPGGAADSGQAGTPVHAPR